MTTEKEQIKMLRNAVKVALLEHDKTHTQGWIHARPNPRRLYAEVLANTVVDEGTESAEV